MKSIATSAMLFFLLLGGCSSSGGTDITLDQAKEAAAAIKSSQETAIDVECTIDNGSTSGYGKVRNAAGTLFIEATTTSGYPKTRLWTFSEYTEAISGYKLNGTINETWPDSDNYTGTIDVNFANPTKPITSASGSKKIASGVVTGTLDFNSTSFNGADITDILTGSH